MFLGQAISKYTKAQRQKTKVEMGQKEKAEVEALKDITSHEEEIYSLKKNLDFIYLKLGITTQEAQGEASIKVWIS